MPYIPEERRKILDPGIVGISNHIESDGELNYVITKLILARITLINYMTLQRATGLLECIKLEFTRRVAAPYEDKKKEENGEVF